MAKFCVNCGGALAEGACFCPNCGAATSVQPPAVTPVAPTPSSVASPDTVIGAPVTNSPPGANIPPASGLPPAPAPTVTSYTPPVATYPAPVTAYPPAQTGSGSGVKILFIVLAVIAFLGLLLAGSCFYVVYRAKQKVSELKTEMGGSVPRYAGARDACAKLSETEASQALGQKVTAVESRGSMSCIYHFGPGGQKQVPVEYTWQGGTIAIKLSHNLPGMENFTTVPGIGDEAYLAPMDSALLMRKGDVMVNIDMRTGGLNGEAAKAMARKIAGNL
jgi:hypothetical protein